MPEKKTVTQRIRELEQEFLRLKHLVTGVDGFNGLVAAIEKLDEVQEKLMKELNSINQELIVIKKELSDIRKQIKNITENRLVILEEKLEAKIDEVDSSLREELDDMNQYVQEKFDSIEETQVEHYEIISEYRHVDVKKKLGEIEKTLNELSKQTLLQGFKISLIWGGLGAAIATAISIAVRKFFGF